MIVSSEKRRIFQILEELDATKQKFSETSYTWLCRKYDPTYKEVFKLFVSKEDLYKAYNSWKKVAKVTDTEEIPEETSAVAVVESIAPSLDMTRISNFLLGRAPFEDNSEEINKLTRLLDTSSKTGNTYMSLMVYKQMERVSSLIDSLEVAERRMYSPEVIESVTPGNLLVLIESINKTIKFSLEFIDKVANRELTEKNKGVSITINQTVSKDVVERTTTLSKPARESVRILAKRLIEMRDTKQPPNENKS